MLKEFIILILLIYFVSRIVRFLLPIIRVSSVAKDHVRKMQQQMNDMENKMNQNNRAGQRSNIKKEGDYIDYEEVK